MVNSNKCKVYIWDTLVGELILVRDKVYFKYDNKFDLEISPLHLKLSKTQFSFHENNFHYGLAGVFADSLPDSFGMKIIDEYFDSHHPTTPPNILDKLLFVGDVTLGALRYEPAYKEYENKTIDVDLAELRERKKSILENKDFHSVKEVIEAYKSFSPVGGARSKMLVNLDKDKGIFSIGKPREKETSIILKLDEGEKPHSTVDARIEKIYNDIAAIAGIETCETYHFIDNLGYEYFATERFDITKDGGRLHTHSLSGLTHFDKSKRLDLKEILEMSKSSLKLEYKDLEEIFRRTVFNYVYNNYDDHLKNIEFLMDRNGKWSLSPAYDLTYNNKIAQRRMRTLINGKNSEDVTLLDFIEVAKKFNIENSERIIKEVESTIPTFKERVIKDIPSEFDVDIENFLNVNNIQAPPH